MKKILVLGGKGFLGKHVVAQLKKKRGVTVATLSRKDGVDITSLKQFTDALKRIKPDSIINCAAHVGSLHYVTTYAADVVRDNMQLISNMYEGVRLACPKATVINPISNCSYPGDANSHYEPKWQYGHVHDSVIAYGSTRRMIHTFAESYRKQYGIKSVNWLIANAYGPGDYTDPNKVHALNGILIRLIKAQKAKEKTFEIWGTGKPRREWVYIEDVARMLVASLDISEQTYPVNLAQNKAYSITEIAKLGAKALNYKVKFAYNISKADGAPIKILDNRIFKKAHPAFKFTPLSAGIRNTISYYRKVV
jgi:GDP-L-fucose synthase